MRNLIGNQYNLLTVIEYAGSKNKQAHWKCLCSCGNYTEVTTQRLNSKNTKSCGCLRGVTIIDDAYYPIRKLLRKYESNARLRNKDIQLTLEEFKDLVSKDCYYCGSAPKSIINTPRGSFTYNGIDRVDNNIGYILSNCVTCCAICNRAKRELSISEFLAWRSDLVKYVASMSQE